MRNILEDVEILKKYKDGEDIPSNELQKINELASIGLVKKGMSFKRLKITAKTSELGLKLIS